MSAEQRVRYWEEGAAVLRSLGFPHSYGCPLCLGLFGRDEVDQLVLGHALPRSLGGRLKVLVCLKCERRSGHELDAHAHRVDLFRRIAAGEPYPPLRARLTFEGISANVQLSSDGEINNILGLPGKNPPGALDQLRATFERHAKDGTTPPEQLYFTLPTLPVSERRAKVSYLRAGYLAAFAVFGYWAVARPSFDRVRQQIQEPDVEHLPHFFFYRHADLHEPEVAVVKEPRWYSSIVVLMGNYRITLPLGDDDGIYERISQQAAARVREKIRRRPYGWPSWPAYLSDRRLGQG